jgi:hypothetical protein
MSIKAIQGNIRADWPAIVERARLREFGSYLPEHPRLFGSSTKVELGEALGVSSRVVYLAPAGSAMADDDRRTLCGHSNEWCRGICLGTESGRMVMPVPTRARQWKTALYYGARHLFRELLTAEARSHVAACKRSGKIPALRPDGSSDTTEGMRLAEAVPGASVYDYTKNEHKALAHAAGRMPANYSLTFSFSGTNREACRRVLAAGGNVAVCFDSKAFPETWEGAPVIDGDAHDYRPADPRGGYVVALAFKAARAGTEHLAGPFIEPNGNVRIAA